MALSKAKRWRLGMCLALAAGAACSYDPRPKEGAEQCSADGKCPDGYVCSTVSNHCYTPANLPADPGAGGAVTVDASGVANGGAAGRGGAGGNPIDARGSADVDGFGANGGAIGAGGSGGSDGSTMGDVDVLTAPPDIPQVVGVDAEGTLDVALGSGGVGGSGGSTGQGGVVDAGGVLGTGGATIDASPGAGGAIDDGPVGTGGATGLNCANAIVPPGGVIADFSDWNATTATWGAATFNGSIFGYADPKSTMNAAKVEGTPKGLHLAGRVPYVSYGGGGLSFFSCATVASFSKIEFDVYGSGPHCAIDLQLQTLDQRPVDQSPPGGCKTDGGATCFTFPVVKSVVNLWTAVSAPGKTVSLNLASFTNWSAAAAVQIVGIQWQFLSDGGGDCVIDATFTNVKLVP